MARQIQARKELLAAKQIQSHVRRFLCQMYFRRFVRHHKAAVSIQRLVRLSILRRRFREHSILIQNAVKIQAIVRGNLARSRAQILWAEKILGAARVGNWIDLERYFADGRAWARGTNGQTCLHTACEVGSKRTIKLCLRYGMDINDCDTDGHTALHYLVMATFPYVVDRKP